MDVQRDLIGLLAGFVVAAITAPVGVSGAVFLLPVQMSFLNVPNPQLTPTNLLYNVVAGPGALIRYGRQLQFDSSLTRALILGSAPGVVIGAILRVHVASDPTVFRVIAACVLLPTGVFILRRSRPPDIAEAKVLWTLQPRTITAVAFLVGIVGGIYGIGGGSILGPILVGTGMAVSRVAPAALASTFVASIIGVAAYAVLGRGATGSIAPDWTLGVAMGIGGLAGGYLGARLQPFIPERQLRSLLGVLAVALSVVYLIQAFI